VASVRPLGGQGSLGPDPGGPARPGHGRPDPRLDGRPGPPLRRRRQKKWDGSGGQAEQALGRSRGGFGTKIHASCDGLGHPVELILTAAQESDIAQAEALLAGHRPDAVIADKGYDKKALVEEIESRGAEAVIPTQKNRKEQREVDAHLYRERNLCERFWSKLKQYRRVATRYEKKAANFLAFVKVAAMMVMLQ
jgi:transposase